MNLRKGPKVALLPSLLNSSLESPELKFGVEMSCNHVKDFMFYHLLFHFMDDAKLHLPIYYSNNHKIPFYLQMEANENFER